MTENFIRTHDAGIQSNLYLIANCSEREKQNSVLVMPFQTRVKQNGERQIHEYRHMLRQRELYQQVDFCCQCLGQ